MERISAQTITLTPRHEYLEEDVRLPVGEVLQLKKEIVHDSFGRPYFRRFVKVGDESDLHGEKKIAYRHIGDEAEVLLHAHPEWKRTIVRRKTREVIIDPMNQAAQLLYRENGQDTQMMEWAQDFPDAIALYPLQHPINGGRMLSAGKLDARTSELFTYMIDAIGIRSRAHIYAQRVVELAASRVGPMNIISVGSGAAVPNIQATKLVEASGSSINWQFFDIDPRALGFAHTLISEAAFASSTVDYGPFVEDSEKGLRFMGRSFEEAYKLPNESMDLVDALGLWEYLRDETAVDFAKKLYAKVKPGGMMIISNMLYDRPQKEFNKRGVGWPHLFRRTEQDLLDLLALAGIETHNVTMTHAEDGVYVVVEIKKP